jgi:hypothetical protein
MKIKYLSLALLLMGTSVSASSVKDHTLEYADDTQVLAKSIKAKRTVKPYTKAGILRLFTHKILTGQPRETFKQFLDIMFRKDFGKPPHSAQLINKGWQCLKDRVKAQQNNEDKLAEIHKTLAFHKRRIAHFDSILAETIPDFPCENCKKTARHQIGLQDSTNE